MKNRNLIICDTEEGYAQALAAYFMRKKELSFQVHICSSPQRVNELTDGTGGDILLISDEYEEELPEQLGAEQVFVLSSGSSLRGESRHSLLYKYQSGEKILEGMIRECPKLFGGGHAAAALSVGSSRRVIGVFSPVRRVGKTSYALNLGQRLAESENVLYMSLELFGGIGGHFEESSQTLSDVLYYARQEEGNLGVMLSTIVCHRGSLDYIAPMPVSEDMKSVGGAEWTDLVKRILEESIYETVILDIDDGIQGLYGLLKICTEIHMPVLTNEYSEAKIRQFEREAELLGYGDILGRIVRKGGRE